MSEPLTDKEFIESLKGAIRRLEGKLEEHRKRLNPDCDPLYPTAHPARCYRCRGDGFLLGSLIPEYEKDCSTCNGTGAINEVK